MLVKTQVACTTSPTCEIRFGDSSWDSNKSSCKYTWFTTNARAARGGEFPVEAIPQIVAEAIKGGFVSLKDILTAIASVV
jgi:hypothetical protein